MNKKTAAGLILGIIIVIAAWQIIGKNNDHSSTKTTANQPPEKEASVNQKDNHLTAPAMAIDPQKKYQAVLKTSEGTITVDLHAEQTPQTANNFVYLSRQGFYNQTIFHRVIAGFMIQGGDPLGDGTGGPGYRFDDEPFEGEYHRGTVAMANAGPNTNGSQFFIMHKDYDLPKSYVIFGQVTEGIEVVDKIATAPVKTSPAGENSQPLQPVVIESIEIQESS